VGGLSQKYMNALLTEEEKEEIEEYESSFWTMSPPRPHKSERRHELEEKRWGSNTIDDILNKGLEFDVERLNSKGHHVRDGYRGVLTFEDADRESYLLCFDSGLESGEDLEFSAAGRNITETYELDQDVRCKGALIDYFEDRFNSEFNYLD